MNNYEEIFNNFIKTNNIPNILLYGQNFVYKLNILQKFINKIYDNDLTDNVLFINCLFGKGIQFIRDELTFFLKKIINKNNNKKITFKSVILLNADYLTIDAQSALRRLIEIYSNKTRFFIIVDNINGIINPIISRFCNFYISNKEAENEITKINNIPKNFYQNKNQLIKRWLNKIIDNNYDDKEIFNITEKLYYKGCSCLDIINFIKYNLDNPIKIELIYFYKKNINHLKNEKIIMLFVLNELNNKTNNK